MDHSFSKNVARLWRKIGSHGIMTLSTCAKDTVTSRSMSVIVHNGKFYCQTDATYLKYQQIANNENVALCYQSFSIEGKCKAMGHPLEEGNQFFAALYQKHFSGSYKRYSAIPTERLLEITPTLIYTWEYHLGKPFSEYFDFASNTFRHEER
jgi:hypothetical protein